VDTHVVAPGITRRADDLGFYSAIVDYLSVAMDNYEEIGDETSLKWAYKMVEKYITSSYDYENGGRIFGKLYNTAHRASNVIDIEEAFGKEWWLLEPFPEEATYAAYGDRFYNQFAQTLYEDGIIEEWEKEYIIEPYEFMSENGNIIVAMSAIRLSQLMENSYPDESKRIIKDMTDHLYQYFNLRYEWSRSYFPAVTVTGKRIENYVFKRQGYNGKAGARFTGINPRETDVLGSLMVCNAAMNNPELRVEMADKVAYIWSVARNIARVNYDLGDIGDPVNGVAPDLNFGTTATQPMLVRCLVEMYNLTKNRDYLNLARVIANNIVERHFLRGFTVLNDNQQVSMTGDVYISELLILEGALLDAQELVPRTFLPSDQYWDSFIMTDHQVSERRGSSIFTAYDTFKNINVFVKKITASENNIVLSQGECKQIGITIYPSDATDKEVYWENSNPSVAYIDENNVIHALSKGETRLRCISNDHLSFEAQAAEIFVTVL